MENICYGRLYGLCNQEGTYTHADKTFCAEHYYEIQYAQKTRAFIDNMKQANLFGKLDLEKETYLQNILLECLRNAGFTGI